MKKMKLGPNCFSFFYFFLLSFFSYVRSRIEKQSLNNFEIKENIVDQSIKIQVVQSITNYWNFFDFLDKKIIHSSICLEEFLDSYIDFFIKPNNDEAWKVIKVVMRRKSFLNGKMDFNFFKDYQYRSSPYNFKSPLHKDLYNDVLGLKYLINTHSFNGIEKAGYEMILNLLGKKISTSFTNSFKFVNTFGANKSVYTSKVFFKVPIFYDLEYLLSLDTIQEMRTRIRGNTSVVDKKKLKIISIFSISEFFVWKAFQKGLNKLINGFNKKINSLREELYDIKVFLTILLIKNNNKFIFKEILRFYG